MTSPAGGYRLECQSPGAKGNHLQLSVGGIYASRRTSPMNWSSRAVFASLYPDSDRRHEVRSAMDSLRPGD